MLKALIISDIGEVFGHRLVSRYLHKSHKYSNQPLVGYYLFDKNYSFRKTPLHEISEPVCFTKYNMVVVTILS